MVSFEIVEDKILIKVRAKKKGTKKKSQVHLIFNKVA